MGQTNSYAENNNFLKFLSFVHNELCVTFTNVIFILIFYKFYLIIVGKTIFFARKLKKIGKIFITSTTFYEKKNQIKCQN